jgi:hypothetical protein
MSVLRRQAARPERGRRGVALASALLIPTALLVQVGGIPAVSAATGPVGNGFTVTTGDLSFILKQIKIAERHSATRDDAHPCSTLVNKAGDGIPDAEQVPDILTSYGLRTVDGSCNNLKAGDENFAAADQLQAEARQRRRLGAPHHQQPHRRPDIDEPGGSGRGAAPGAHAGPGFDGCSVHDRP